MTTSPGTTNDLCPSCHKPKPCGLCQPKDTDYGTPIKPTYDDNYIVALTTAPRISPVLPMTIRQLRAAGWEPHIFSEPDSLEHDAPNYPSPEKLGVWHNWLNSCSESLWANSEYIITCQDDITVHPDLKIWHENFVKTKPHVPFLSAYTSGKYKHAKDGIIHINTHNLWGACFIFWERDLLEEVIDHPLAKEWLGVPPRSYRPDAVMRLRKKMPHMIANSDTAISRIMNKLGVPMHFMNPSPVTHAATISTVGHGSNSNARNCKKPIPHSSPIEL